jgi:A/G-specific adenine glycosylase
MDYGTHLKKQVVNPSRQSKHYSRPPKFVGSNRQLRGQVLKAVLNAGSTTAPALAKKFSKASSAKIEGVIEQLVREGYIRRQGRRIAVVQ